MEGGNETIWFFRALEFAEIEHSFVDLASKISFYLLVTDCMPAGLHSGCVCCFALLLIVAVPFPFTLIKRMEGNGYLTTFFYPFSLFSMLKPTARNIEPHTLF